MLRPLLAASLVATAATAVAAQPLTLTAAAFGSPLTIEVRDLPAVGAEATLRAALAEIEAIERLTAPEGGAAGGLGALNAAAGGGARAVDPRLAELLARAGQFCIWSQGANGPLGGRLVRLWERRNPAAPPPDGAELEAAVASAVCSRLKVDSKAGTAELAADSRLDLAGFAAGFAVDRAVGVLRDGGAADGRVALGDVQRAFGPGPDGGGWRASLPAPPALAQALAPVRLHDRALAVAAGGGGAAVYLDQRTGRPASGVVATAAATELAVDAQALAVTMLITGSREGSARLGTLRPAPAVLWLLGGASGPPILTDYHWSQLRLETINRRTQEAP